MSQVDKTQPESVISWLQTKPSLDDLDAKYPELWESVRREIAELVTNGNTSSLQEYLKRMTSEERLHAINLHKNHRDKKSVAAMEKLALRNRMAYLAIKQHLVSEATGVEKGKIRFNLLNGYLAQKLLFHDGLERKPVSMFWFRLVWPLLWQRRLLMPLVQPEGIYCFYSQQLIDSLAALIGDRDCLEIAAGNGALTRFLDNRGVRITATDDYSWNHEVKYPGFVVKRDAREALRLQSPQVVICSWPPAGNPFERHVFKTRSVQLYIVIGSRHRLAAGNWDDYDRQSAFEFGEDNRLSRLVLPPELNAAVYVFRRKTEAVNSSANHT